ncbi:MAG: transpeptidase family protein [Pseudoflavonifractor sp.]|nr:transpeptidase family protein [Alloprevotella sp.]MCM1117422.1 transpeptidase family protein [Pseudoflavonifractor sp.]
MASGKRSTDSNRRKILLRYFIISMGILLFCAKIVWNLVDTTIISANKWNAKANEWLSQTSIITPDRGDILASDGSILATNLSFYTVRIDYRAERFMEGRLRQQIDTIADSMARYFPIRDAAQWKQHILAPLDKPADKRPRSYRLIRNISYADLLRLKSFPFFSIRNANRNGLTVETAMKRVNPYGSMARRSIGAVGQTLTCSEIHGRSGLEGALDSLLYGTPGIAKKIPLTQGIVNWTDTPAVAGLNIITTIDIKMQDIVENELNDVLTWTDAEWGVAVLMEVATGDIKAISNLQKADNGSGYVEGVNRAVLGYEPGSVIKTLSMMIALEDGIARPNEVISTGHSFAYAGGRPISDSHGVGSMTVAEVIERSSNIGMTKIITRRYNDHPGQFYSRVKSIGFLEPFNTGISGERTPRFDSVPDNRGGRITLSRQCYGYATEIPPLYTLSLYNAIANGGRYVRPRLVGGLRSEGVDSVLPVTYIRDRICSEQTAATLRGMLANVVWGEHGTARRLRSDKVRIAGKTGTCYMVSDGGGYDHRKRLAFCGFFPADDPKYSCIVLTCNPRQNAMGAASTSGEVLKNIALKLYSRGMLGNSSDYHVAPGEGPADNRPTLYASTDPSRDKIIKKGIELGTSHRVMTRSKEPAGDGTVPDVRGLGFREAINILERSGFNVAFTGSGYVATQTPCAGSKTSRGASVTLTLTE